MHENEHLAFCELVRQQACSIAALALAGNTKGAAEAASSLATQAAQRKRAVLGKPEPDPTIDYDPDFHWDGTPLQPGEKRREKGEPAPEGYDLGTLPRPDR